MRNIAAYQFEFTVDRKEWMLHFQESYGTV